MSDCYPFYMRYEPLSRFIERYQAVLNNKDFARWSLLKEKIQTSERNIICKPGMVWWCLLGLNIGHEQDGKQASFERPVLIIKVFSNDTCLCIPLSTSKQSHPFFLRFKLNQKTVYAITSQIRTLSIKRLVREMSTASEEDLRLIKDKVRWTLD